MFILPFLLLQIAEVCLKVVELFGRVQLPILTIAGADGADSVCLLVGG